MLIKNGWQPHQTIYHGHASEQFPYANFKIFWDKGFWEVEYCSGTGLAECGMNWMDVYGNILHITTSGEEDDSPNPDYHAGVSQAILNCAE